MKENLIKDLSEEKILPIIRNGNAQEVIDTAKALSAGGIKIVEINVENPEIYGAIAEVSRFMTVCAGGIITSLQAQSAISVGAEILSSPIFHMNLVKISKDRQIPFIAGASTPNEVYNAWKARIPLIKLYPVTAMGGVLYVEDLLRPMPFLKVLPQGNVKMEEVPQYINAGAVAVGVGRDLFEGCSYAQITERAKNLITKMKG